MGKAINFKRVRESADFLQLLDHYNIEVTKDGQKPGQYKCLCPFHDDQNPSLKVNTQKNLYHCFVCDAGGNVLEFVMNMENLEVRPAAEKLLEVGSVATTAAPQTAAKKQATPPVAASRRETLATDAAPLSPPPGDEDGIPYNRILDFELKLERTPEMMAWCEERGITENMIDTFGLGMASKRSKTIGGRLAIPIHNEQAELVAYCGRSIDGSEPKYRLPTNFRKDLVWFNLNRVRDSMPAISHSTIVIVESFLSVIKHHDTDNEMMLISPMGRSVSPQQIELLMEKPHWFHHAIIIADGDEPGRHGARDIARALAPHLYVRVLDLPDGLKPHHLSAGEFSTSILKLEE